MIIAVDLDGVLGDQVNPVLEKLNKKFRLNLTKKDIVAWDTKIAATSIDVEIEQALLDEDYVQNMPPIDGAKDAIDLLRKNHTVFIASHRPEETEAVTREWLESNFDITDFVNTRGKGKASIDADLLIDDRIENINDFSRCRERRAILFDQPWNRDRRKINDLYETGLVNWANSWSEILEIINRKHS